MSLYRETPCEHGMMNEHPPNWGDSLGRFKFCPGGSREEVTINIEAATAEYKRMVESDMEGADWNYEEFVYAIVAAALTRGDTE